MPAVLILKSLPHALVLVDMIIIILFFSNNSPFIIICQGKCPEWFGQIYVRVTHFVFGRNN